ncbi:hypothetical protein DFH09DRAFT_1269767 [Mycena vulgaris]|nr:hypothetical protein DFH09DRAFT_1269767 [Mycena vulgaris]
MTTEHHKVTTHWQPGFASKARALGVLKSELPPGYLAITPQWLPCHPPSSLVWVSPEVAFGKIAAKRLAVKDPRSRRSSVGVDVPRWRRGSGRLDVVLAVTSDEKLIRRLNEFDSAETVSTRGGSSTRARCSRRSGFLRASLRHVIIILRADDSDMGSELLGRWLGVVDGAVVDTRREAGEKYTHIYSNVIPDATRDKIQGDGGYASCAREEIAALKYSSTQGSSLLKCHVIIPGAASGLGFRIQNWTVSRLVPLLSVLLAVLCLSSDDNRSSLVHGSLVPPHYGAYSDTRALLRPHGWKANDPTAKANDLTAHANDLHDASQDPTAQANDPTAHANDLHGAGQRPPQRMTLRLTPTTFTTLRRTPMTFMTPRRKPVTSAAQANDPTVDTLGKRLSIRTPSRQQRPHGASQRLLRPHGASQ